MNDTTYDILTDEDYIYGWGLPRYEVLSFEKETDEDSESDR